MRRPRGRNGHRLRRIRYVRAAHRDGIDTLRRVGIVEACAVLALLDRCRQGRREGLIQEPLRWRVAVQRQQQIALAVVGIVVWVLPLHRVHVRNHACRHRLRRCQHDQFGRVGRLHRQRLDRGRQSAARHRRRDAVCPRQRVRVIVIDLAEAAADDRLRDGPAYGHLTEGKHACGRTIQQHGQIAIRRIAVAEGVFARHGDRAGFGPRRDRIGVGSIDQSGCRGGRHGDGCGLGRQLVCQVRRIQRVRPRQRIAIAHVNRTVAGVDDDPHRHGNRPRLRKEAVGPRGGAGQHHRHRRVGGVEVAIAVMPRHRNQVRHGPGLHRQWRTADMQTGRVIGNDGQVRRTAHRSGGRCERKDVRQIERQSVGGDAVRKGQPRRLTELDPGDGRVEHRVRAGTGAGKDQRMRPGIGGRHIAKRILRRHRQRPRGSGHNQLRRIVVHHQRKLVRRPRLDGDLRRARRFDVGSIQIDGLQIDSVR